MPARNGEARKIRLERFSFFGALPNRQPLRVMTIGKLTGRTPRWEARNELDVVYHILYTVHLQGTRSQVSYHKGGDADLVHFWLPDFRQAITLILGCKRAICRRVNSHRRLRSE